ncbi:MAG: SufE family protein [Bdellovibrionales bacterium]|nr:SufE family protein [Bdellovibrionales bacterium]
MTQIEAIQNEIVNQFQSASDWESRYKMIIQIGRELPDLDESQRIDENLVKGCQSRVWMSARLEGDRVIFEADSDASIVKGLVALLLKTYSGHTPDEILNHPPHFIEKLGLNANLSQTRASGLASMVKQIKFYALAFKAITSRT